LNYTRILRTLSL